MNLFDWISLIFICFVGASSPGPSLIIIISSYSQNSLTGGIYCSVGHGLGIFLYAILTTVGLSYFLVSNNQIFYLIKLLGIMFLFLIGFKLIAKINSNDKKNYNFKINNSFIIGLVTSCINPKILLFFIAIFSQFIEKNISLAEKISISILASLIDIFWYLTVIFFLNFTLATKIKNNVNNISNFLGVIMILISIYLSYNLVVEYFDLI